jgi:HAE1 family hydrophobic/amphiphilic exporter-1
MNLPSAYTTTVSGRARELERTFTEFIWAFILSIIFMYMILASQFESTVHPLTILLSSAAFGSVCVAVVVGTGDTLNLYSALGILVLFGVVKKNAILQIDHMNSLRERAWSVTRRSCRAIGSTASDPDDYARARCRYVAACAW